MSNREIANWITWTDLNAACKKAQNVNIKLGRKNIITDLAALTKAQINQAFNKRGKLAALYKAYRFWVLHDGV